MAGFGIAFCISLLFVSTFAALQTWRRPRLDGRIVGGTVADICNFPYQLSMEKEGDHQCGGSIISDVWVVTAAHCVEGELAELVQFRAGSSERGKGGTIHHAAEFFVHPKYDSPTMDYDIAIVKVRNPFIFGPCVQPIPLATNEPEADKFAIVSGWGTLRSGGLSLPSKLQQVAVPIVSRTACIKAYSKYGGITPRMVCAGLRKGGIDSCQGDSGGPLVDTDGHLIGVVSWGIGCGTPGYPGVYSNVANLREFITEITRMS